jgi:peptide/nickel transport system substrate-binding protein
VRRSRLLAPVLVAVVLGPTAACSSSPRPADTTPCNTYYLGAVADTGGCDDPNGYGPATVAGATRGGTVTVLTHHGLRGPLDPARASAPDVVSLLSGLVTRSLTQYRYDERSHEMVVVPDLASSLGNHNERYTVWVMTLRPRIRFQDGTRVTAADVVRGIRRCVHERRLPASPCREVPLRSASSRGHVVVFHFYRPFPDLPYLAASPAFGPVPAPGVSGHPRRPWATGPYQIASYRRGHDLTLVRNSQWDPTTDVARTQYPERYVVRAGVSSARIARLLRADEGSAQTTLTYDAVDVAPFRDAGAGDRVALGPTSCTTYLAPDNRTIADPRVRRALIWAYPYRAVLRVRGLVPGVTAIPATRLVPPVVESQSPYRVRGHPSFATEPRVARRMLSRAHALGTRLRFSFIPGNRASQRTRDDLMHSLRAAGFDPEPVPGEPGAHVDLRTTMRCGPWPSGEQWLGPVYGAVGPNRRVEQDLRRIRGLPLEQMAPALDELDRMALRSSSVVPLWYGGVAMAHGSRIEGMADDSVHGMPTWKQIWVRP